MRCVCAFFDSLPAWLPFHCACCLLRCRRFAASCSALPLVALVGDARSTFASEWLGATAQLPSAFRRRRTWRGGGIVSRAFATVVFPPEVARCSASGAWRSAAAPPTSASAATESCSTHPDSGGRPAAVRRMRSRRRRPMRRLPSCRPSSVRVRRPTRTGDARTTTRRRRRTSRRSAPVRAGRR